MSKKNRKNKAKSEQDTIVGFINEYGGTEYVTVTKSSEGWDMNEECIAEDCSYKGIGLRTINIPGKVWDKIMGLTRAIDTEWLGYFVSEKTDTAFNVTDVTVPEQEAGAAVTDDIEKDSKVPSYGVVHSHVNMSAFFSGTDNTHINVNHDFSIVVNKRGEWKAVQRLELPCGLMKLEECDINIICSDNTLTAFIEQAKEKIKSIVSRFRNGTEQTYGHGYDKGDDYDEKASQHVVGKYPQKITVFDPSDYYKDKDKKTELGRYTYEDNL